MTSQHHRHWPKLILRLTSLYFFQRERSIDLVSLSYDASASTYDAAWTNHMRDCSDQMLSKLPIRQNARCLDLACGTGYVVGKLAQHQGCSVVGVDSSEGMLMVARQNNPEGCLFVHDDILQYLRRLPSESVDVVTCAWGLGYSQPSKVLHEISRVLKPGGRIGVIDNSILSLREMYLSAFQVLAEQPDALTHVLQIRFLLDHHSLRWRMRMKGLHVLESWGGSKRYAARTGAEAIARMKATGAAAGFEHSFNPRLYKQGEERFMEVLNGRYGDAIPIVHRYLAAVAVKP